MTRATLLCLALVSVSILSCKGRSGSTSRALEATANAQTPAGPVLTSDKKSVYPSKKMVAAAAKALTAAQSATDPKKFKALVRLAKLQLRMRPAGVKESSGPGAAGGPAKINCTLASPAGSQTDNATIAYAAAEDDFASSNGFKFKFKDQEGETVSYTYSYNLSVSEGDDGRRRLDVFFQENEVVQDETGSFSCDIPEGTDQFCVEPVENEGEKVGDFFCRRA